VVEKRENAMKSAQLITFVNILLLLAVIFAVATDPSIYTLQLVGFFAVVALGASWYKKITINRPLLVFYICMILVSVMSILPESIPVYLSSESSSVLFLYAIIVVVGIYTTFFTKAGFVGVIGDNQKAIRNASLALLGVAIAIPIIILILGVDGQAHALRPSFVIYIAYEIFRRHALSQQHVSKVE